MRHSASQALIDSPEITRCVINFKRLDLLDLNVEIERTPKKGDLKAAFDKAGAWNRLLASTCALGHRSTAAVSARGGGDGANGAARPASWEQWLQLASSSMDTVLRVPDVPLLL